MTIVPMLRVGMQFVTLCVASLQPGEKANVIKTQARIRMA
ncbi:hypothetical protein SAMN05444064_104194 [Pseudomonas syringae]|nr:hypothetical protein SAMN05444514_104195 [Pseudomonas syringae]SFL78158.1 hypothetical protein SAMN05444064_104194 [Pseudomonas syringae]